MCKASLSTTYHTSATAQKLPRSNVTDVPSLIDSDSCSLSVEDIVFGIATFLIAFCLHRTSLQNTETITMNQEGAITQ